VLNSPGFQGDLGKHMAVFFAKTWFLWYAFAVVVIMRWFHVAAPDVETEVPAPQRGDVTHAEKIA
jgi:hypothetical protein